MSEEANILSEIMSNQLLLNQLLSTIDRYAEPRWTDIGLFCVGIGSIIASLTVARIAYLLNKKQISIADKQTEIADTQCKIMEQQNKIALLEKRMEVFYLLEKFSKHISDAKRIINNKVDINLSFSELLELDSEITHEQSMYFAFWSLLDEHSIIEHLGSNIEDYKENRRELFGNIHAKFDKILLTFDKIAMLYEFDRNTLNTLKEMSKDIKHLSFYPATKLIRIVYNGNSSLEPYAPLGTILENLEKNFEKTNLIHKLIQQTYLYEIKD